MSRALFGLLKGLIAGAGISYGLLVLGKVDGPLAYLACGLVGAVVGLICGRAPWRAETIWTPALKMIFGLLVGTGLYALGRHFLPGQDLPMPHVPIQHVPEKLALNSGAVLAPVIGALYGLFVEVDDGGAPKEEKQQRKLPA